MEFVGRFLFGRPLSMVLSLLAAVVIWYFFMQMRGWTPPVGSEPKSVDQPQ